MTAFLALIDVLIKH